MSRLTPLRPDEDPGAAGPALDAILAARGWVPALYRTLARSPRLLDAFVDMTAALRSETTLPAALRELAILSVAHDLKAGIQWAAHVPLAIAAGVDEASIAALDGDLRTSLGDEERAVVAFALEVTRHGEPTPEAWRALESFLDERQLLELTLTVGFYNMVARFLRTSALPVDREYQNPPSR